MPELLDILKSKDSSSVTKPKTEEKIVEKSIENKNSEQKTILKKEEKKIRKKRDVLKTEINDSDLESRIITCLQKVYDTKFKQMLLMSFNQVKGFLRKSDSNHIRTSQIIAVENFEKLIDTLFKV